MVPETMNKRSVPNKAGDSLRLWLESLRGSLAVIKALIQSINQSLFI